MRKQVRGSSPGFAAGDGEAFVEALMSADADAVCRADYGERFADASQPTQRQPRARLGHVRRFDRACRAEAARGLVLSGLAVAAAAASGAGARVGDRRRLPPPSGRPTAWSSTPSRARCCASRRCGGCGKVGSTSTASRERCKHGAGSKQRTGIAGFSCVQARRPGWRGPPPQASRTA